MNNEFNNQLNNDNNLNNDYGMGNQPVQPQFNNQPNNMYSYNQGGLNQVQPNPVPPVQPNPVPPVQPNPVPPVQPNPVPPVQPNPVPPVQPNPVPPVQPNPVPPVQPNPAPPVQPQFNNINNGFTPYNNFNQPVQPMYQNGQNFGPQPNSPYTNSNRKGKGSMVGIIGVIAVIIIVAIFIVPILTAPSPKGTWTCQSTTIRTLNFTNKSFTFSGSYSGFNTTLTGKYKLSRSNVKPAKKKDGFKYYLYGASDVKAVAGPSSQSASGDRGFILGYSKDKKTIHYLSRDDNSAMSFECKKNDN